MMRDRDEQRPMRYAALIYFVGIVVHTADHFRRGTDVITSQVLWLGYLGFAAAAVAFVLILMRHPLAPLVSTVVGFSVALGVSAVHLLPHWSSFSDAFPGAHGTGVTGVSYAVVLLEIAGALALGITGLRALRDQGGTRDLQSA
ncbi:MAG TPA: hypothetical protein VFK89_10275 [Actinomycetota bacterium]|nr:hypothetical protein [Actinomycetota bacterium]